MLGGIFLCGKCTGFAIVISSAQSDLELAVQAPKALFGPLLASAAEFRIWIVQAT
jgi:hypothetical protein